MGIASSIASRQSGDVVSQIDPHRINVLFVCDESNSSKSGLSAFDRKTVVFDWRFTRTITLYELLILLGANHLLFNRKAAINLAKISSHKIKVFCYVY